MLKSTLTKENYGYTKEEKEYIRKIISKIKENKGQEIDKGAIENIYTDMCIRKGLKDIEAGNVLTTEELLKEIDTWK